MRLSIVLALTLMVVVASVAEAKPKAKPLSVKVGLKVNTDGTDGPGKVVPPTGEGCEGDLVDVAVAARQFTTLVKVVTDLGLVDTIKGAEALTIFAPNDAAFAKVDPDLLASLTPEQKKEIVLRHVVVGKVMAADVVTGPVKTFGGEEIDLVAKDGGVQISYTGSSSNVIKADVQACNGVIHVIDSVILPAPVILPG